jgi:ceramide glucosyltransferase
MEDPRRKEMILAYGAAAFSLVFTSLNLLSILIAMYRARPRKSLLAAPSQAPFVSLVRPVCGRDNFCEETLGSSFSLDYPHYEVIFCVARANDPIVPVVETLIAANTNIPARLIVGDEKVGANPKLNNCVRGWDAASAPWIVLADANVLMPPDYIQRLLASWRPRSGLVCSMPLGSHPQNLAAEWECAFLNSFEARWQFCGEVFGLGFAQGKTMLWRRDVLESGGGIRALASEIAEDAASTKLVRAQKLKVHLIDSPFEQPLGARRFRDVWQRQSRWARMRRATFPWYFLPEIFAGAALPLVATLYAALAFEWPLSLTLLGFGLIWYGPESLLTKVNKWHFSWSLPALFLLRDLMLPIIYIDAWCVDSFSWRGNEMNLREDEPSIERG